MTLRSPVLKVLLEFAAVPAALRLAGVPPLTPRGAAVVQLSLRGAVNAEVSFGDEARTRGQPPQPTTEKRE